MKLTKISWLDEIERVTARMGETGEWYPYEDIEVLVKAVKLMDQTLTELVEVNSFWVSTKAAETIDQIRKLR